MFLTFYRISLENQLDNEKKNNNIYNNERNSVNRYYHELKSNYSNEIKNITNIVNTLSDQNDNIISRKDNIKNIAFNNAKAIEPDGYKPSLLVENFVEGIDLSSDDVDTIVNMFTLVQALLLTISPSLMLSLQGNKETIQLL
jgi:hypothetical protein